MIQSRSALTTGPTGTSCTRPVCAVLLSDAQILGADEVVDHVGGTGLELQDLGILIGHDPQFDFVEVRQRFASRGAHPVMRVAAEYQPHPGHVLAQREGAKSRELFERRADAPGITKGAAVERRFELMARQDGHAFEERQA